ncbi:MAG: 50S ribosomal protein L30 [Clostridiales bacterium]|jgi:large subunit ribosomal protein L30|nr:50S ribosomal protein L30 [Clostridiales bacterium]
MKLKITLMKSPIATLAAHKATVAALGLRKIGQTVIKEDIPSVRGQVFTVRHMIKVEEIND